MSQNSQHSLAPLLRKLGSWQELDERDAAAVLALPFVIRDLPASQFVVWEQERAQHCCVLLSGFAYRHKEAGGGRRQMMSIHMKGDCLDLQNSLLGSADHNVQMLSAGRVAVIPVQAIRDIAFGHPNVGMAMWCETLVEGSIFREWILNIGQRDAITRIAHLLCEFAVRLECAELGKHTNFALPITQDQLAEAVSLTPVHVNRMLRSLDSAGLIVRTRRNITIPDWHALAKVGDFHPHYLHVNQDRENTVTVKSLVHPA